MRRDRFTMNHVRGTLRRTLPTALLIIPLSVLGGCGAEGQLPPDESTASSAQRSGLQRHGGSAASGTPATSSPSDGSPDASPRRIPSPGRPAGEVAPPQPASPAASESTAEAAPAIRWTDAQLSAAGIRRLRGEHLTLYTDLPAAPAVDALPAVFDQAVPQWCAYFQIPQEAVDSWLIEGYLMRDPKRFRRTGMYPRELPAFLHGFQRGSQLWLFEQPSDYYRRHLLLHEGTHGFMRSTMGGAGPPWYMEGVAELLATHRWDGQRLTLGYFPGDNDEVPLWGRIKKVQDELKQGRGRTLQQILQYDPTAHIRVAPYAWCWAAAAFLDSHPVSQARFRGLHQPPHRLTPHAFEAFYEWLDSDPSQLHRQWQLFTIRLEYGYDVGREAIELKPVTELPPGGATVQVDAARGWQSSGIRLQRGQHYRIEASGRYQVANQGGIWWCEPNGVTLRYYGGLPLGMLLGAVVPEEHPVEGVTRLATPDPVGLGAVTEGRQGGTLFLRINDSPAELHDNRGQLTVAIQRTESDRAAAESAEHDQPN